jgi:hypothetical protein
MTSIKGLRQKGFRYRRVSFTLKVFIGIWAVAMLGVFLTKLTFLGLMVCVTGTFALGFPGLLLAAVFDELADREFAKASAQKQGPLLGVVRP